MTAKFLGFITFAGLLLLAGCGGGSQTSLTGEQKAKLKIVFTSMADIAQAPVDAKRGVSSTSTTALEVLGLRIASADTQSFKSRSAMAGKLTPALCKIALDDFKGGSGSNVSGSVRVSGEKCPIELDFSFSGSGAGSSGSFSFHTAYSVKDPEFKKLTDVDSAQIQASIEAKGNSGSFSANGSMHSQSLGEIKISGSGEGNAEKSSFQLTFTFTDFVATFQMENSRGNKMRITVNGEELDSAKLKELGLDSSQNPYPS